MEVRLRPGELLYIPRGYYHSVESTVAHGEDEATLEGVNQPRRQLPILV